MADYATGGEEYTAEQYGQDPYEGGEAETYNEDNTQGSVNMNHSQSNTYRGGRGRGNSRGSGGFRGNSRGGNRGAPRGGFAGQKRGFQQQQQQDEYGGNMAVGTMEFVKKRKINDNVHRILVPTKSVKFIIGPQGETIKGIKEGAGEGCKISIYTQGSNKVPLPEGTAERVVSIEGNTEQLKHCLHELVGKIQGAPLERIKGRLNLKIMVPEHCCSAVIGPKGAHSKKVKEDTGTLVQVYTDPLPGSGEHVVALRNQESDKLVEAAASVFDLIMEHKSKSNVLLYEPHLWNPGEFGNTGSYHDELYAQQPTFNQGGGGGFNQGGGFNNQGGGFNNQGNGGGFNQGNSGGGFNQGNSGSGFNNQGGGYNNQGGNGGFNQGGGGGYNQGGGNQGGYTQGGYNDQSGYEDQTYYVEEQSGYNQGGNQGGYQDNQEQGAYQGGTPRGRGGNRGRALLGSSPATRGGGQRGGNQQRGGGNFRGGRGGNGQSGGRGAPRGGRGTGGRGGGRGRGGN